MLETNLHENIVLHGFTRSGIGDKYGMVQSSDGAKQVDQTDLPNQKSKLAAEADGRGLRSRCNGPPLQPVAAWAVNEASSRGRSQGIPLRATLEQFGANS